MTAPTDTASLIEDLVRAVSLRCHSHPGEECRSATERAATAKQALLDALTAQAARIAELEGALKPFAVFCGEMSDKEAEYEKFIYRSKDGPALTFGHFRRARKTLGGPDER